MSVPCEWPQCESVTDWTVSVDQGDGSEMVDVCLPHLAAVVEASFFAGTSRCSVIVPHPRGR